MIRAIVTDIEGTTTDIRFVHNVLFPYARERLERFIRSGEQREPVNLLLNELRGEIHAPAASVGPSRPSEPAASRVTPSFP